MAIVTRPSNPSEAGSGMGKTWTRNSVPNVDVPIVTLCPAFDACDERIRAGRSEHVIAELPIRYFLGRLKLKHIDIARDLNILPCQRIGHSGCVSHLEWRSVEHTA